MEMRIPSGIDVALFVKDDFWRSAYWTMPRGKSARWQSLTLQRAPGRLKPTHVDPGFDENRVVAVGWQFTSESYEGNAAIEARHVQLIVTPTNPFRPAKRYPLREFVENCGVDLPEVLGEYDFVVPSTPGPQQRLDDRRRDLESYFQFLREKNVALLRTVIFRDLSSIQHVIDHAERSGVSLNTFEDVDALLAMANRCGIRVLPVLFDYRIAEERPTLIADARQRQLLCQKVLEPFFRHVASSEAINEIEVLSNTERVADKCGVEATREFTQTIAELIRHSQPRWKVMLGYDSRASLERLGYRGFQGYTVRYDPINEASQPLKVRRDRMKFPKDDIPIMIVARLPLVEHAFEQHNRPVFSAYAMQDAFDYGYSGITFTNLRKEQDRQSFEDDEVEAFSSWISGDFDFGEASRGSGESGKAKEPRAGDVVLTAIEVFGHVVFLFFVLIVQVNFIAGIVAAFRKKRRPYNRTETQVALPLEAPRPYVTVMLPTFQETKSLGENCRRFQQLNYPRDKCELLILTEEGDSPTNAKAKELAGSFGNVRHEIVPAGYLGDEHPRTKPRALKYGLTTVEEQTEIIGVLDAEDKVDTQLLAHVVEGIQVAPIVQGRLAIGNQRENWLSYWLGSEYAFLEFLQDGRDLLGWMKFARGSTYFVRRSLLEEIQWSTGNLTEDLAFNVNCYADGYETRLIDATTWEECPVQISVWLKQRTRWFQGTLQTIWESITPARSWRLGWKQRCSVWQLLLHVTLVPLLLVIMFPLLLYDCVVATCVDPNDAFFRSNVPLQFWGTNAALLALVCAEFAMATAITYRERSDRWKRVLFCVSLPIMFMVLLPVAAIRAHWRQLISKEREWEKTPHRGETLAAGEENGGGVVL